ncbi:MAG TPA: hypothetical protein VGW74_06995 [Propionibacteriaceae bacterium]|nr:hypothetical protein [Propionibacteriaceae bacterium]
MARLRWEQPQDYGGAREWRGFEGNLLAATIHKATGGAYPDTPYAASIANYRFGRFPTLDEAILAVQRKLDDDADAHR